MLRSIRLRFGSSYGQEPLEVETTSVTILVGPNNSGKSLTLREIESLLSNNSQPVYSIINGITPAISSKVEAEELIDSRTTTSSIGNVPPLGHVLVAKMDPVYGSRGELFISKDHTLQLIDQFVAGVPTDLSYVLQNLLSLFTVRLDGRTRFGLTEPKPAMDLLGPPQNHLMALFQDEDARRRLRETTFDAFGFYFVLDPTNVGNLRVRMSSRLPVESSEEQSWNARAREFHRHATDIAELSDGVKAFTGITAAILSGDYRIILVDEPEAFLHPVLARQLGRKLTELASERKGNVLAATHSSDFLMGCVQTGSKVNVVRLTYRQGVPSARLLLADRLQEMMRDPLLRSTGVLSALFYQGTIVCEADSDRAFYQEINERLLAYGRKGAENSLFLNAQNKQTVRRIVRPLREVGIPAATIVDLDVFKDDVFKELLKSAFVPETLVNAWGVLKGELNRKLKAKNEKYAQNGGILLLDALDKESAQIFIDNLAEYGIFVVASGELESWLRVLRVSGPKSEWVPKAFEAMGSDPADAGFLKPQRGDVWDFMEKVAAWIENPRRKGIPE